MIISIIDEIGEHGPLILIIMSIFLLWSNKNQLIYCIIGNLANVLINMVLKGIFQQPRPCDNPKTFKLALKNGNSFYFKNGIPFNLFGMPSGHAQSCLFSTMFIFMCLRQYNILGVYLLISILTAYQRIKYSYHTLLQVLVGGIVGICVGYIAYRLTNNTIKGVVRAKRDDNAYI